MNGRRWPRLLGAGLLALCCRSAAPGGLPLARLLSGPLYVQSQGKGWQLLQAPALIPLPGLFYSPPALGWSSLSRLLLPLGGSLDLYPRSAAWVMPGGVRLLEGSARLRASWRPLRVAADSRHEGWLLGELALRRPYGGRSGETRVQIRQGSCSLAGHLFRSGASLSLRGSGEPRRRAPPRLLLPPVLFVPGPSGRGRAQARHWLREDLARLVGASPRAKAWPPSQTLTQALFSFVRWQEGQLQGMLSLSRRLGQPWRGRLFALVLELGSFPLMERALARLDLQETAFLQPLLRRLLFHPCRGVRQLAARALARLGDPDAFVESWVFGVRESPGPRGGDGRPSGGGTLKLLPGQAGSSALRSALRHALVAEREGRSKPLKKLVRALLNHPRGHWGLLLAWSRRGVTRLALEAFLGSGHLPAPLLDLAALEEPEPLEQAGDPSALGALLSAEQERQMRRQELQEACLRALETGQLGIAREALAWGHWCGGRRWLAGLHRALRLFPENARPLIEGALRQLLERDVDPELAARLGWRGAWIWTLKLLQPGFVPRGEGLLWGAPDRVSGAGGPWKSDQIPRQMR